MILKNQMSDSYPKKNFQKAQNQSFGSKEGEPNSSALPTDVLKRKYLKDQIMSPSLNGQCRVHKIRGNIKIIIRKSNYDYRLQNEIIIKMRTKNIP